MIMRAVTFVSAFTGTVEVNLTLSYPADGSPLVSPETSVMKMGTLTTTAVTANQVILTYTVSALKNFYLEYVTLAGSPTVFANNLQLGTISLQAPGTIYTVPLTYPAAGNDRVTFAKPVSIPAGTVIRVVCTPALTTSTQWFGNFGGFER